MFLPCAYSYFYFSLVLFFNYAYLFQQKGLPYDPLPETQVEDWGLPDPAAFPELLESVVDTVVEKVQSIRL
jgi:hypothetical protein